MNPLLERLVSSRKAAGISQAAAAESLKMSRPTFIAMEKGIRAVKPEELLALAQLYGTSLHRLVRQSAPPTDIAPHLRASFEKEGERAGVENAVAKLTGFVDDYMFLRERVGGYAMPSAPPQPVRSPLPVERFAEMCAAEQRESLGFSDREPVSSLRKTLDERGVHVFIDALDSKLAGLYAYIESFGYCILVNRKHPQARRRWTIAHEYGHFLFDRNRRGIDFTEPMKRKPENERFADSFAMHFLMPSEGVRRRFQETYQQKGDVNVGDVLRVADYYGVSLMAMVLRLESLGLIPKGSWDAIKSSGAKVKEIRAAAGVPEADVEDSAEIFPERYIMLAIEAWSAEKITTSQFAKLVRKSVIEARDLAMSRSHVLDELLGSISLRLGDSLVHKERRGA